MLWTAGAGVCVLVSVCGVWQFRCRGQPGLQRLLCVLSCVHTPQHGLHPQSDKGVLLVGFSPRVLSKVLHLLGRRLGSAPKCWLCVPSRQVLAFHANHRQEAFSSPLGSPVAVGLTDIYVVVLMLLLKTAGVCWLSCCCLQTNSLLHHTHRSSCMAATAC